MVACGGSFLAFLDATITNLAVPDLAGDFHVGVTSLSWVVTLYTIMFAALLAPAGWLADVVGRVPLFVTGVGVFTAASLLAAVAPTLEALLVARGVQGVGAALLIPASLAFVLADTPPERRAAAIGLWSASAALAAAAGPALGGVLVDTMSWRALFCINVPVGGWLVWQGWRWHRSGSARPAARGGEARRPDAIGTVALAGGIGVLVLGVTEASTWGWASAATIGCLVGSAVLVAAALRRSAGHPSPAVEIGLWSSRTYAAANVVSFLFGAVLYTTLLLGVLYLIDVWDYSELAAGLAMTPGAVASAIVGIVIGRLTRRPSPRALVIAGSLVLAGTTAALALWLPAEPRFLTAWLPSGLGLGLGIGACSVGVSSAAALSVAPVRFAAATGLNVAVRQIGGALGVAVLALLLNDRAPSDGIDPFLHVYWMVAAVSAAAALAGLALVLPTRPTPTRPAASPQPAAETTGQTAGVPAGGRMG